MAAKQLWYVKGKLAGGKSFSNPEREEEIRTTRADRDRRAILNVCAKIRKIFGLVPGVFVLENPRAIPVPEPIRSKAASGQRLLSFTHHSQTPAGF